MRIEYGISEEAAFQMCLHICRKDRIESSYFCDCLEDYIKNGAEAAGAYSVSVYDSKDRLLMLAGVNPGPEPDVGFGWVLRTKFIKVRNKDEKRAVVKLLADLLRMIKEETPFRKIGNSIHAEQTASLVWMDKEGFNIQWDNPGTFFNKKNKPGVFLTFTKEI